MERLRCPIGRISGEEERLVVSGVVRSAWQDQRWREGDERTRQREREMCCIADGEREICEGRERKVNKISQNIFGIDVCTISYLRQYYSCVV